MATLVARSAEVGIIKEKKEKYAQNHANNRELEKEKNRFQERKVRNQTLD